MFPPDLPPVSNKALYAYRVFAKLFAFFFFGLSSLVLAIVVIPIMRLLIHPKERFQKPIRRLISTFMRFFISLAHILRIVDMEIADRKCLRNLSSKIIVANHPSILDVVILLSLIPNADCIVNARLNQGILRGVVSQLYILNSLNFEDLIQACVESLKRGNCLIIFPEGTRTPRTGKVIIRKGAARIAAASGCNIVPIHIGGTDKFGLGKKDPWTGFNPNERYIYDISVGEDINPEKYKSLSSPAAVRAIMREYSAFILPQKGTV